MKADDAMQPSAFIFFYFVGNSKTPNDVFGFFYWLKVTAVWVDGCTAVNWLVPLRCRWQIQQGREQEKTRSNAKRCERAVRLCFWPRGSLDYIKVILKSCIVTSGFFHRGIIPLMTSFFLACASKKRLSPHRWNRAMPQGRPLSFILNRMIIKAVYYCFWSHIRLYSAKIYEKFQWDPTYKRIFVL